MTSARSPTRTARKALGLPVAGSRDRSRLWFALAKSAKMHPLQRRMISCPGLGLGLGLGFGFGFGFRFGLATQDDLLLISAVAPRLRGDN